MDELEHLGNIFHLRQHPLHGFVHRQPNAEDDAVGFFELGNGIGGKPVALEAHLVEAVERVLAEVENIPEVLEFVNFIKTTERGITR